LKGSEFGSIDETKVGCITTDFAIQNVLLQMGMHLISIDGLAIKKLRQWMLICFSCNKKTNNVQKVFCQSCGNNTLWRIPVTISEDGTVTYNHNMKKRVNLRGTKYSIPLPKGGRNNNDLILTEDEFYKQAKGRRRAQADITDPDFSFWNLLNGKNVGAQVGYGKKNPNVSRKKFGKKNKTKMNQM